MSLFNKYFHFFYRLYIHKSLVFIIKESTYYFQTYNTNAKNSSREIDNTTN